MNQLKEIYKRVNLYNYDYKLMYLDMFNIFWNFNKSLFLFTHGHT